MLIKLFLLSFLSLFLSFSLNKQGGVVVDHAVLLVFISYKKHMMLIQSIFHPVGFFAPYFSAL